MPVATITGVTGGVRGMAAAYSALLVLAALFEATATRLRDWAGLGRQVVTNLDLVESALLSPATFALAEEAVLAATVGPSGVLVDAAGWEIDALLVRALVRAFEDTDDLARRGLRAVDDELDGVLAAGLVAAAPLWLPPLAAGSATAALLGEDPSAALQAWAVDHPGIVQQLMNGAGVAVGASSPAAGAAILAGLFGSDGSPSVHPYPGSVPESLVQPAGLADLMTHLEHVSEMSEAHDSPANGTIEIQAITGADGRTSYIVYLPGADDMATLPWTQDGDVRDMGTNMHLMAGSPNSYQAGILQAMHDAGIGPGDPVLLVGQSQGGIEAAAILSEGSPYDVTDVLTAGSPTAQLDGFPAGSHVTSLEHDGDVVPLLDGAPNPDTVEQVTVHFDDGPGGGIVDHHAYVHYVAGAAAADASDDPSIAANLASLHHHGFLSGSGDGAEGGASVATVTSQLFQIVRVP